jgi:hypothetical protein
MTYTLKITPTGLALLEGYCRAAGRSIKDTLSLHLTETAASHPAAAPAAEPVHSPIALPVPPPATVAEPEDELPDHDIEAAFDNFMTR